MCITILPLYTCAATHTIQSSTPLYKPQTIAIHIDSRALHLYTQRCVKLLCISSGILIE